MAHTTITNLAHAPIQIILAAITEMRLKRRSLFNSPVVRQDNTWASRCVTEGGVQIEIPILKPLTGGYTLQNPGTPPTVDNMTSDKQVMPIMYREKAWGRDSFSASQSGMDPLNYFAQQVNAVRDEDMESSLVSLLTGVFKSSAFSALTLSNSVNEAPVGSPGSNVQFNANAFHDILNILGEREDDIVGGTILMHSKLRTYLKKLDEIQYVKGSDGQPDLPIYKGLRIVVDDRLRRAGTTSGFVYPLYIAAPGSIILSQAPQSEDGTLSSSLAFDKDIPNLRAALYDRIVYGLHVNGTKWQPASASGGALTVAKAGPTEAQLATVDAWGLVSSRVGDVKVVRGEFNIT